MRRGRRRGSQWGEAELAWSCELQFVSEASDAMRTVLGNQRRRPPAVLGLTVGWGCSGRVAPRSDRMQHPILKVLDGEQGSNQTPDPWAFVLEGYERALEAITPDHPQYARLLRCRRLACELAHRPLLEAQLPSLRQAAQS